LKEHQSETAGAGDHDEARRAGKVGRRDVLSRSVSPRDGAVPGSRPWRDPDRGRHEIQISRDRPAKFREERRELIGRRGSRRDQIGLTGHADSRGFHRAPEFRDASRNFVLQVGQLSGLAPTESRGVPGNPGDGQDDGCAEHRCQETGA
jgi:hypothetical protein